MKYIALNVKEPIALEDNTILRFLGQDYRKDYQDHLLAFEIIGKPVSDEKKVGFNYVCEY